MSLSHATHRSRPFRSFLALALLAVSFAGGLVACEPTPPPTLPCPVGTWGSTARSSQRLVPGPIVGVRAGRHPCFDRFVVDLGGSFQPGWSVRYGEVRTPGRGELVRLRGGATIEVVVDAPAYDATGHATFRPADASEVVDVSGWTTFRQAAFAGSFEGTTTFGLGVRARLPFRVTTTATDGAAMLVIDVAHAWPSARAPRSRLA